MALIFYLAYSSFFLLSLLLLFLFFFPHSIFYSFFSFFFPHSNFNSLNSSIFFLPSFHLLFPLLRSLFSSLIPSFFLLYFFPSPLLHFILILFSPLLPSSSLSSPPLSSPPLFSSLLRVLERVWDDPFAVSFIETVDTDTYDDYLGDPMSS